MILMLLLQVAQPAPEAAQQPDIQLDIGVTAQRVVVDNRGRTSLTVRTSVNGQEGEGNVVDVRAPELPPGQRELRNVQVHVRAEARVANPVNPATQQEPASPQ